jgi:hypothetical protein
MSNEPSHKPYEWAEKMFQNAPDVAPKYKDMLAMLAFSLMGNEGAAQHFYAKAVVDGASDAELKRVAETAKIAKMDIGDMATNVQKAVAEIRAEQESLADEADDSQVNLN